MDKAIAIAASVVKKHRTQRGLRQVDAAKAAGVNINTYQKWERDGISEGDAQKARWIMSIIDRV